MPSRCRRPCSTISASCCRRCARSRRRAARSSIACVDEEFFLIARQDGPRISLLLSDLTASVEYPLAEQALARLGEDPPDDDELDEVWPVGDLDLFADLDVTEDEMERHPRRHRRLSRRDARRRSPSASGIASVRPCDAMPREMAGRRDERFAAVLVAYRRSAGAPRRSSLDDCESVADIADVARDVAGEVRLVLIEQDDEYAAIVRVDDDDDEPRAFLSDGHAADAYPLAAVVAEDLAEIGEDELGDDEDAPPAHDSAPFGDAEIVEDLGTSPATCSRCARTKARCRWTCWSRCARRPAAATSSTTCAHESRLPQTREWRKAREWPIFAPLGR